MLMKNSNEKNRLKILIVDDSRLSIKILADAFKKDYDIITATSGAEALEKANREKPSLILLDVVMKELDGFEVCKLLKAHVSTKDIPVIFITGKNREEDELRGLEAGAVDYIVKPFRMPIVKARVETHLELKLKRDILHEISSKDGLTNVFNRRMFDQLYQKEWERALLSQSPLAVILFDLDHFKLYNDTYGHLAGDNCLQRVAKALQKGVTEKQGVLARYGGEEFGAIFYGQRGLTAEDCAKNCCDEVEKLDIEHQFSPTAKVVTISAGISSILPQDQLKRNKLLDQADRALYQAKQKGRNQCFLFE